MNNVRIDSPLLAGMLAPIQCTEPVPAAEAWAMIETGLATIQQILQTFPPVELVSGLKDTERSLYESMYRCNASIAAVANEGLVMTIMVQDTYGHNKGEEVPRG